MKSEAMARHLKSENGSALLITMMVMVILTLLGLSYLFMADTESLIASNQRDSDQLLFVAEGGAEMVKAWFDRPPYGAPSDPNNVRFRFLNTFDMRDSSLYDRTQRVFDHDDDPNTPEVTANGSTYPYHRQGMTVDPNAPSYLSFFDKPFRGGAAAEFRGTEAGPDLVMMSNSLDPNAGGSLDVLDQINALLFDDQPNTGRIQRIDVYGPPVVVVNGTPTRFGIATVQVTSAKFTGLGKVGATWVTTPASRQISKRVVKMVLNEAPYPKNDGGLQSCSGLSTNDAFTVHWGATTSVQNVGSAATQGELKLQAPESIPWASSSSHVSGPLLDAYVLTRTGTGSAIIADPWYRRITAGTFSPPLDPNTPPGNLLLPYPYVPALPLLDDNSNLFAHTQAPCPAYDYDIWKLLSLSGSADVHYFVWTGAGDSFQENGTGVARSFAQWTNGARGGFYFFDTADRKEPEPGGGNLTPPVTIADADNWAGAGFIYLNASNVNQTGMLGDAVNRVLLPPGEPYVDANGNRRWDSGEQYVNLTYPTTSLGASVIDPSAGSQTATLTTVTGETFSHTTSTARDPHGIPILQPINWYGLIYTSGTWESDGDGAFYGSLVARAGVTASVGTPHLWYDERLARGEWPPPDIDAPRTMVTVWQTDL